MYQHLLVCNGYFDRYFVISGHFSCISHCFFTMSMLNFLYTPLELLVDWLAIVFSCLICTVGTFTSVRCTMLFVVLVCSHFQFWSHYVTWAALCVVKYRCLLLLLSVRFTFSWGISVGCLAFLCGVAPAFMCRFSFVLKWFVFSCDFSRT